MNQDQIFMKRCLELAALGWPKCRPNPMVGCVIVHKGKIIGEGYHQKYGGPHAEVNAINAVVDKAILAKSTLYVSLEPCAHHGKTPPCSDFIVQHKLERVVIATTDTFSEVRGKGIKRLKDAGIKVDVGFLENEARNLNKRFFCIHEKNRPYVILKWAESKDGFIDKLRTSNESSSEKITGPIVQQLVHQWRAEEQSILVGGNTVRLDNSQLNVRQAHGPNPLRIIISAENNIPESSLILIDGQATLIFNSKLNLQKDNLEWIKWEFNENWIEKILIHLAERDVQSIFIEGGKNILDQFIASSQWDEIRRFIADKPLINGITAPKIEHHCSKEKTIGSTSLKMYYNKYD
jgi:diaminohydroxyphosphoribosylaminopyrimidine deaminase/5-amino-6-(5-phosphoribosylamino)uracil reductase